MGARRTTPRTVVVSFEVATTAPLEVVRRRLAVRIADEQIVPSQVHVRVAQPPGTLRPRKAPAFID